MTTLAKAALALAGKGMRVFPCVERGKDPLIKNNLKRATTDPNIIAGWWRKYDFKIGIATGRGCGIWVLDIDGAEGEATLRKLETEHGALPSTVEVITGDGRHLYFGWPAGFTVRNSQCREDLPGLEWRGDGGYVLAPPSIHPSGRAYSWSVDSADTFAYAPDWLIALVTSKARNGAPVAAATPESWRSFVDEDVDGSRRGAAIARLYGLLVRRYIDPVVALGIVRNHNKLHCQPPLDDAEVVRIANDIANREAEHRRSAP